MSKGRHSVGHVAGHPRSTPGSRKAAPGARKAPPAARKASPTRVGGAKVEGRRVADGGGRPVVLTALGSGEKIFALLPLAILSVASVVGLTAEGSGDPAASPSPADSATAAGSVEHATASRQVISRGTASSARPAISETPISEAPTSETATSETVSPVVVGEDTGADAADEERQPMDRSRAAGSMAKSPPEPADRPAEEEPEDRPAEEEPTTPIPTAAPTAAPDAKDSDKLTRAEATARCLESGISRADVVALEACVEKLQG